MAFTMILKTTPRQISTEVAPLRQPSTEGPEQWGQWSGRKHYSLEVVQHPLRARMCGFGDKDRRPLAPAAVAKMLVRRDDNTLVDVDDVDCSFFLVTVDLWSADGKHEMNLVLHPSSADRYVPAQPKPRRRGASTSAPHNSGHQTPTRSTPNPQYSSRMKESQSGGGMTPIIPHQAPGFSNQGSYFSPQPPPMPEQLDYQQTTSYGPTTSDSNPAWGFTQTPSIDRSATYPPVLPSIQSFGRSTTSTQGITSGIGEGWHQESSIREETDMVPYRAWNADTAYQVDQASAHDVFTSPTAASSSDVRESHTWSQPAVSSAPDMSGQQPRYSQEATTSGSQLDHSMYASASYAQHSTQVQYYPSSYGQNAQNQPQPSPSTLPPLPRHTYTRTLVGPLSANACRLLDEHRKPGIFFLFQDLSVRTEGTFRLRMRLMNVGASPAPEAGATRVHTDVSPVLAQTFTDPFVVYSAKRFPGVPDTTALSIAFGNQGQKLPLRNRHGSSKQGRRRRGDSGSDDDDSD